MNVCPLAFDKEGRFGRIRSVPHDQQSDDFVFFSEDAAFASDDTERNSNIPKIASLRVSITDFLFSFRL